MTARSLSHGPAGIATGLRVPLTNAHLDRLVNAIVGHAKRRELDDGFAGVEDATRRYAEHDDLLYEARDRIGREVADDVGSDRQFVSPLLQAVDAHREWRQAKHAFRDLYDVAREHHGSDVALYSIAAVIRSVAARSDGAGIAFDRVTADAVLRGRKTVMRTPVEFTRTGKCVKAHYRLNGGDGGTYPLLAPSATAPAEYEIVPGHRLKIASVRMERFGDVTDDEARLEGLEGRLALINRWWELHGVRGKYLFEWEVRRYEFELIEL